MSNNPYSPSARVQLIIKPKLAQITFSSLHSPLPRTLDRLISSRGGHAPGTGRRKVRWKLTRVYGPILESKQKLFSLLYFRWFCIGYGSEVKYRSHWSSSQSFYWNSKSLNEETRDMRVLAVLIWYPSPISSSHCLKASSRLPRPEQMPEPSFQQISGEYNQLF